MTAQTRTTLKGYFETGDVPTQAQFVDLIDSSVPLQTGACACFILPELWGTTVNVIPTTASLVAVYRFYLPMNITVATVYTFLAVACDNSLGGVGIYSNNGASLLINAGGVSLATSGIVTVALSTSPTLSPGFYLYGFTSNIQGVRWIGLNTGGGSYDTFLNSGQSIIGRGNTGSLGTLPSTVGAITEISQNVPMGKFEG